MGTLTSTPIAGAQTFADHCSSPPFLHCQLIEDFSGDETVRAKVGFERMAASNNVQIHHYRAENGCFSDRQFHDACAACNQTLDFCGVGENF